VSAIQFGRLHGIVLVLLGLVLIAVQFKFISMARGDNNLRGEVSSARPMHQLGPCHPSAIANAGDGRSLHEFNSFGRLFLNTDAMRAAYDELYTSTMGIGIRLAACGGRVCRANCEQ